MHTTIVGLGVAAKTDLENILDDIIVVKKHELKSPHQVAVKIGNHVARNLRTKDSNRR